MPEGLMKGRKGLVLGVANNHSIAWGIAKALADQGAELAFTYQGEAIGKRVMPLAESVGSDFTIPCDVVDLVSVDSVFAQIRERWGKLDFLVHAVAYSDKNELRGNYADTTRENFINTMVISCFSFTELAKRAAPLMTDGGSLVTLTFSGGTKVMPNYNVMASPRPGWRPAYATWHRISAGTASASTRFPPVRSAHSPGPGSPMRASCTSTRATMRRCAVRSPSRTSVARRCTCSRTCPRA